MAKESKLKNFLSNLLRVSISAALLWYLSTQIDFPNTIVTVKSADWAYLFYAFAVYCLIFGVLLLRWFKFIHGLKLKLSVKNVIRYFFIGLFGNLFLPSSIGGDFIKIVGLCRETDEKVKVVASVLLDRLSGFAGIVIVAVVSFTFGYSFINNKFLLIFIVLLGGLSGGIILLLFNEKMYAYACQIFDSFPKIKEKLMNLHYDITLMKGHKIDGFKAIGYSCLAQVILAISYYFTARALNQSVDLIYFLIFVPLICVISSLPSIGGLGFRELGAKKLFTLVGVTTGVSVSISLINFIFMVIVGLIGGLVYYVSTISSGRVQHLASDSP